MLRRYSTLRRKPLSRKPKRSHDEPRGSLRAYVFARDGGCVAPIVDPRAGRCRVYATGQLVERYAFWNAELDRVRSEPGAKPVYSRSTTWCVCSWHHKGGWATSKAARLLARAYLASKEPQA